MLAYRYFIRKLLFRQKIELAGNLPNNALKLKYRSLNPLNTKWAGGGAEVFWARLDKKIIFHGESELFCEQLFEISRAVLLIEKQNSFFIFRFVNASV